jgi:hypothetical protein
MLAVPLIQFAAELLLVGGLFQLIILLWPDSFIGRGLTVLYG